MVCQTWPEFSTLNSLHKFWQIKQWQEKIKPAPEYWNNLHSNFQLDFLFDWLAHPLFFFLWYSHGKEIMAKGPLHETNQPAKSHKNVEGILQSNYEETVSVGTERRPDQLHVCVGCARVPPQAESIGVQQGRFYLDRGSPNQASESDLSQEKVAELQAEPAGRWLKGRTFPWFQWPQEVFGSWVHCNDSCPTPGPSQSSEVLSAAAGPQLHSLLLLSEHCHRPALLPNITNSFGFHFMRILWSRGSHLWPDLLFGRGEVSHWLQPRFKCTSWEAAALLAAPGNTPCAEIAAWSKEIPFALLQTHSCPEQEQQSLNSLPGSLLTPDPSATSCAQSWGLKPQHRSARGLKAQHCPWSWLLPQKARIEAHL